MLSSWPFAVAPGAGMLICQKTYEGGKHRRQLGRCYRQDCQLGAEHASIALAWCVTRSAKKQLHLGEGSLRLASEATPNNPTPDKASQA